MADNDKQLIITSSIITTSTLTNKERGMFIPTYEVSEESRKVSYWDSLLAEHIKNAEAEEKAAEEADLNSVDTNKLYGETHT